MVTQADRNRDEFSRGFTLIELLLTTVLLLLLLGAVVFSFSTLQQGAGLDEGATQFEALLRFARAQAANTGHPVQINFEEEVGEGLTVPLGNLRVLWEPDPVDQPGILEPLPDAAAYVRGITELVSVEDVRPLTVELPASEAEGAMDEADLLSFQPVTFYPDGSSDSAEIILASRDGEDERLVSIRLTGVTGLMRRQLVAQDETGDEAETAPEAPAKQDKITE